MPRQTPLVCPQRYLRRTRIGNNREVVRHLDEDGVCTTEVIDNLGIHKAPLSSLTEGQTQTKKQSRGDISLGLWGTLCRGGGILSPTSVVASSIAHGLPVDGAYSVALFTGVVLLCGSVPSDGFVSSCLVAFAAGDACVGDGVGAAFCVWGDVVGFWAGWLEGGVPCEGASAVGAVGLAGCSCEVEDSCAPFFVAGGSGS